MKVLPRLLLMLALCLPAIAQTSTLNVTFVNGAGDYPHCVPIVSENGQPTSSGEYACFQPTSFTTGNGFSLYLPDVTLENCSIAYGTFVPTSGSGTNAGDTVSQTDAVACSEGNGWTGHITENFVKVWGTCHSGSGRYYHTYSCLVNSETGGSGSMSTR